MRPAVRGLALVTCLGCAAQAAAATVRVDLPAGPLSAAITAIGQQAKISIGTSEPHLLGIQLPELHVHGSLESVMEALARRAGVKARRINDGSWQLSNKPLPREPTRQTLEQAPVTTAIIVEGTKRPQSLLDDPSEIYRISDGLERFGRTPDTRTIANLVPTLVSTDWGDGHDKLFLRGVADSSFPGSSPSLVGQYLGDLRLNYDAPDPNLRLYDIASVEVMEGPQGTLYGAGALGGLVRIEPRAPVLNILSGAMWSGITSTAHGGSGIDGGAILNLPLVEDRLGLRLVGYTALEPGYIDDLGRQESNVNRVRIRGGRAALRWAPSDDWTIDLLGIGQSIDARDAPYADAGAPPLTRSTLIAQPSYHQFLSGGLVISRHWAGATFRSTTGIVHQSFGEQYEAPRPTVSPLFIAKTRSTLASEEARLSGGGDKTNWVIGFSALSNTDFDRIFYGLIGTTRLLADIRNNILNITEYSEATNHITSHLHFTIGERYDFYKASGYAYNFVSPLHVLRSDGPAIFGNANAQTYEHHFTPSFAVSYKYDSRGIIFARYERGFRPGGLTDGLAVKRFSGDSLETIEAGIRRGISDQDRIAISFTGATSRWRNIQADQVDGRGLPYIANIGDGRIRSIDLTASARPAPGWQIDISGFLARGHLNPVAVSANHDDVSELPNAVHNGGLASLNYRGQLPGGQLWRAELRLQHVGKSLFGTNPLQTHSQGGYTTLALGGEIHVGRAAISFDASNLTDSKANAFAVGIPLVSTRRQITPLRPRTLRMGVRYDF